jgi:hypothetical protein
MVIGKQYAKRGEAVNCNGLKRCSACTQFLSIELFDRNKRAKDGYQNVCSECRRAYHRKWYAKRKSGDDTRYLARQASNLRRSVFLRKLKKFNLTETQYDELAAKGCAICSGPPRGRGRYHFDHEHLTGKFRGLLCSKCNPALGLFNDNQTLLMRAMGYLARHVE